MFSNAVLNVFNNPQNAGRISKPDGIADCFNENQTAHVEFSLRIEAGIITDCKFRAQANPYIVAICSTMTNMVKGKMCSLIFLDPYSIKTTLGDESDIDIMFCIDCLKLAIQDYKEKLEKSNKTSKNEETETSTDAVDSETISTAENVESQSENEDDDFDFSDFFEEI